MGSKDITIKESEGDGSEISRSSSISTGKNQPVPDTLSGDQITELVNLVELKIKSLKKRATKIEKSFEKLESGTNKSTGFIMFITGSIAVAFFLVMIGLVVDYKRLDKNLDQINENGQKIKLLENNSRQLECLRIKGYFSPKCLEG